MPPATFMALCARALRRCLCAHAACPFTAAALARTRTHHYALLRTARAHTCAAAIQALLPLPPVPSSVCARRCGLPSPDDALLGAILGPLFCLNTQDGRQRQYFTATFSSICVYGRLRATAPPLPPLVHPMGGLFCLTWRTRARRRTRGATPRLLGRSIHGAARGAAHLALWLGTGDSMRSNPPPKVV